MSYPGEGIVVNRDGQHIVMRDGDTVTIGPVNTTGTVRRRHHRCCKCRSHHVERRSGPVRKSATTNTGRRAAVDAAE